MTVNWNEILSDGSVEVLLELALREDLGTGDATTQSIFRAPKKVRGTLGARQETVVCGGPLIGAILRRFDPEAEIRALVGEGEIAGAGVVIAEIEADVRFLLSTERVMLNFLMRCCGVASAARRAVEALPAGSTAKIYDTRKTMPGWRRLDKAAVSTGGAENHRFGLFDAMMIKDNHIAAAGSISAAIRAARAWAGTRLTLEVEVDTLEQFDEALAEKPDIILLDNFTTDELREAVKRNTGAVILEASGGITLATIPAVGATGVDRISMGALTHSAVPADLGLDF